MTETQDWRMLDMLTGMILKFSKGCVVEIGIGASTKLLMDHASAHNLKFYTCDLKSFEGSFVGRYRKFSLSFDKKDPEILYGENMIYANHIHFEGPSLDFIKTFKDTPSIVFLDGCHDYEVVKEEFYFFFNLLKLGGVIFIHDTLPFKKKSLRKEFCSDAYRLRREIESSTEFTDCFTWSSTANNVGLTMVMKRRGDYLQENKPGGLFENK